MTEQLNTQTNTWTDTQTSQRVIKLPDDVGTVDIIRIRFSLKCSVCGYEWGTNLLHDFSYPMGWRTCRPCEKRKSEEAHKDLYKNSDLVVSVDKGERNERNNA